MELVYRFRSCKGARPKNEDALGFCQPANPDEWPMRGAVSIICDGVGGQGDGDIASLLAVEKALEAFDAVPPASPPATLLRRMFYSANLAVYDAGAGNKDANRHMATTMTAALFRHHQVHVGHVGDCRVYHIQGRAISRITTDHSYTGMQMKLGLISVAEAADSPLRHVLTRSLGRDPTIHVDFYSFPVLPGDLIVQCCDGVYSCVSERELFDVVNRSLETSCDDLIALCERRGADDNLSVQVIQIRAIERLNFYRGTPIYEKVQDQTMNQELQIDQILDDRYQIIDQISKSGMASIYRAIDLKDGHSVALKVPYMRFESDPAFFSRFEREQEIGSRLRHPFVLRIDSPEGLEKSRPYLVMEYLQGQTLGQLMKSVRPIPEVDALKIASRLCDAMRYLHENAVIHRDLKPDNIMICDDGSIRIMDFGIAKLEGARRLTFGKFQPAMGTPDYMAPEQVRGQRGDARTDIYSLGAILYEMVTGCPPFEGSNPLVIMNSRLTGDPVAPRMRNPQISEAIQEIILHAMARPIEERYASATEMRHDLDYPFEVQILGRAKHLQPAKVSRSRLGRHWPVLIAAMIIVLFFLYLLLTRLRIHLEFRQ